MGKCAINEILIKSILIILTKKKPKIFCKLQYYSYTGIIKLLTLCGLNIKLIKII